jgi:hypothetical protein
MHNNICFLLGFNGHQRWLEWVGVGRRKIVDRAGRFSLSPLNLMGSPGTEAKGEPRRLWFTIPFVHNDRHNR